MFRNKKLKENFLNALPYWLGAFMIGVVSVLYTKLFVWAEMATHFIYVREGWLFLFITPLAFVLALWLVQRFAPFSRGSGIPQVSAAIELSNPMHNYKVNKLLSIKIIFIKIVSSVTMVFGGGEVGREGPTIQISASIFKKLNDWLPAWYPKISKRNMIVTGAAAGLASAFNTPLGGIVFAIEELTKTHFSYFKSALLTGVIIAGFTALGILGPYLYLGYPQLDRIPPLILFAIIPIAVITGLAGTGVGQSILFIIRKKKAFKKDYQKLIYAALCGLIIAVLAVFVDSRTFGTGKDIMITSLFTQEKHVEWYVPVLRTVGPIISFSSGASGGIFAPALSAGASVGAAFSGLLHLPPNETNLVILCGMTGLLTGITRSPFTSSILVLEMTNSHNIIFYVMLTALISNLIADFVSRHSFYDQLKDDYINEVHKTSSQIANEHIKADAKDL